MRLPITFALIVMLTMPLMAVFAADGTAEGSFPASAIDAQKPGMTVRQTDETYVISPFESVSISQSSTWQDNRHRAYYNTGTGYVNGFLLFDVTEIPDGAQIQSMTLRCYLENAFGSPSNNPVVDVYYSADDGWTRYTAQPGGLSLDVLLVNDVAFTSYVPSYDFVLNVSAHDWTQDLIDNQICIGFTNDVTYYSYVYFFGAYGSPVGPAPELTIETAEGPPPDVSITMTPINPPIIIPSGGGSFDYNVTLTNNETGPATFDAWIIATLPGGGEVLALGPINLTRPGGSSVTRLRTQNVPGGAPAGMYTYTGYVGYYPGQIADSDFFTFAKDSVDDQVGGYAGEWANYGESFDAGLEAAAPAEFALLGNYPNPFNPTTTIRYVITSSDFVNLTVFDLTGREVAILVNGHRDAGSHEITCDASALASGVYLYRLTAGDQVATGKMVLMK